MKLYITSGNTEKYQSEGESCLFLSVCKYVSPHWTCRYLHKKGDFLTLKELPKCDLSHSLQFSTNPKILFPYVYCIHSLISKDNKTWLFLKYKSLSPKLYCAPGRNTLSSIKHFNLTTRSIYCLGSCSSGPNQMNIRFAQQSSNCWCPDLHCVSDHMEKLAVLACSS